LSAFAACNDDAIVMTVIIRISSLLRDVASRVGSLLYVT
jgi:hypothetical protein